MIRFSCSKCETPLRIDSRFSGRTSKCPACGKRVTVPSVTIPSENVAPTGSEIEMAPLTPTDPGSRSGSELAHSASPRPLSTAGQAAAAPAAHRPARSETTDPATGILIPRWLVFTQGGLLATVALTFFLFGFMVGRVGYRPPTVTQSGGQATLSGSVFYTASGARVADLGAVAFILPIDTALPQRLDPENLRPTSFEPFDNPGIEDIQEIGGRVVRVNADGEFAARVQSGRRYQVLVVSRHAAASGASEITKIMRAELGGFFLPLEDLLQDREFHWQQVSVGKLDKQLPVVIFGRELP